MSHSTLSFNQNVQLTIGHQFFSPPPSCLDISNAISVHLMFSAPPSSIVNTKYNWEGFNLAFENVSIKLWSTCITCLCDQIKWVFDSVRST